eukprot:gene31696-41142_t
MALNMDLNINSYNRKQEKSSPTSERWKTTSESELQRVAAQLVGTYDQKGMKERMVQRKLNNTKTSINFGNEKVQYISDAQENQTRCQGGTSIEERAAQAKRIKDMKAELTTTSFKLGDEEPEYITANSEGMRPLHMPNGPAYARSPTAPLHSRLCQPTHHHCPIGEDIAPYFRVGFGRRGEASLIITHERGEAIT